MFYKEFKPSLQLSQYIDCYWVLEIHENSDSNTPSNLEIQKIHPYGFSELIIHYHDNFEEKIIDGKFDRKEKILLTGQLTKSKFFRSTGKTGIIGIRFRPEGLFAFTKINTDEFENNSNDASAIWDIKNLKNIILNDKTIVERIMILEKWLLQNLRQDNRCEKLNYIGNAVEEI